MVHDKSPHQLVHQELALDSYLKTLLDEIPSDDAASALDNAEAQLVPARQQATEPLAPPPLEQAPKMPDIDVEPSAIVNAPAVIKRQPLSLMPEWSRHEFQALFFKVDQLILAAPLTELLRTVTITRQPTKIPGQPSWFIGLLDNQDKRVGVLDTGQLVYGKSRGGQRDLEQDPFKSILITQDGRWGLACDEVLSISKLEPEKVRWRTLRKKRPWLIGTVIEELTAVIDVQQLVPHRKPR